MKWIGPWHIFNIKPPGGDGFGPRWSVEMARQDTKRRGFWNPPTVDLKKVRKGQSQPMSIVTFGGMNVMLGGRKRCGKNS
jgi:hypothetical protein